MIARRDLLCFSLLALVPAGARAMALPDGTLSLGAPRLSAPRIAPDGTVEVTVDATNDSLRPARALVRIYVHDQVASVARPALSLAGAQRVALRPGERRALRFTLGPGAFSLPTPDERIIVEPGLFDIMVGPNRSDLQSAMLEIA